MGRPEEWCVTGKGGEERKSIDGNGLVERKNFKPLAAIASSVFSVFLLTESLFPPELGLLGNLLSGVIGIMT